MIICFSGIGGKWKKQHKKEITWNRFINTHGGEGKNVPMDRYNEFLNADFKGKPLIMRRKEYSSYKKPMTISKRCFIDRFEFHYIA